MSRSYKKKPFISNVVGFKSNKEDRKANWRMFRRAARIMLHSADDYERVILPYRLDEFVERWSYADDGRVYAGKDIREITDRRKLRKYIGK